ncbi:uncharacterized protein LOC123409425 [Hordeum vulgare subsp. vulgare]|uniref:uncharacterized protein LOC123409425 n=1 Tax=Hordeum vulgare subsp. vulgare TaxID=112509 RepID=UPI001D1A379B|nr:uncharacterized protein LOC123409425 [Hordeum vulgare subsp. vulgare]
MRGPLHWLVVCLEAKQKKDRQTHRHRTKEGKARKKVASFLLPALRLYALSPAVIAMVSSPPPPASATTDDDRYQGTAPSFFSDKNEAGRIIGKAGSHLRRPHHALRLGTAASSSSPAPSWTPPTSSSTTSSPLLSSVEKKGRMLHSGREDGDGDGDGDGDLWL